VSPDELQRALLDPTAPIPSGWPKGAWGVLLLFLIPVGGGIPAGVLMARDYAVSPPVMMVLYFISDVILAFVFEPMLLVLRWLGRGIPFFARLAHGFRTLIARTGMQEGKRGPLGLILVSFSVDPMTGRAAAAAAGHGFVPGWALAITGDMFYFAMLMVSTLWLDDVLGNERWTIGLMLLVTLFLPTLLRRWTGGTQRPTTQTG
jgi:hypothetical protein